MGRKNHRQDGIWLSPDADPRRLRDAEDARKNRAEITKALSHGQVSRRDLVKWGLFTSAGLMLPIGGLNPFVRPLNAQPAMPFDGNDCSQIPTGLPPSPT